MLPKIHNVRGWRHIRFWLIQRLSRGDLIMLNTFQMTPHGWDIRKSTVDQGALVSGNYLWVMYDGTKPEPIPGELIMACDLGDYNVE